MAYPNSDKLRAIRQIDDALWADLGDGAQAMGEDRSSISRRLYAWYVGRAGAELPERPPPHDSSIPITHWPDLVGSTYADAEARIRRDNPDVTMLERIYADSDYTADWCTDRVRILVDENDIVIEPPGVG